MTSDYEWCNTSKSTRKIAFSTGTQLEPKFEDMLWLVCTIQLTFNLTISCELFNICTASSIVQLSSKWWLIAINLSPGESEPVLCAIEPEIIPDIRSGSPNVRDLGALTVIPSDWFWRFYELTIIYITFIISKLLWWRIISSSAFCNFKTNVPLDGTTESAISNSISSVTRPRAAASASICMASSVPVSSNGTSFIETNRSPAWTIPELSAGLPSSTISISFGPKTSLIYIFGHPKHNFYYCATYRA